MLAPINIYSNRVEAARKRLEETDQAVDLIMQQVGL